MTSVLTVGLFDGIAALRVAVDSLNWHVVGHVSVELSPQAQRVVESRFPNTIAVSNVADVNLEMVKEWAQKFSQVALILVGGGPPCQGVSGLNASRKGALRDARSSLFSHVSRVRDLLKVAFPWAQIRSLMESVASMDFADEHVMTEDFGVPAWSIDAKGVSLARRPRLYWFDWEIPTAPGVRLGIDEWGRQEIQLEATLRAEDYLLPGWHKSSNELFPTFTTSRPRDKPGYKPAGLKACTDQERERWVQDKHRFPPYQYRDCFTIMDRNGTLRVPNVEEREVTLGFPRGYTQHCLPKGKQGSVDHQDLRLTLLGNSWNVTVIVWILGQLGQLLGLNPAVSPQDAVNRTAPGCQMTFQTFLHRPWMTQVRKPIAGGSQASLVRKLMGLVSMKGEDILLQAASEDNVRYHRIRASIPSRLWKWRTAASWQWTGSKEHINALELRAVLTSLRWRLERKQQVHVKFVHLVDSLVCLHCLSRGRSSSRKLRRTLLRTNALLLATRSHVVWAYVRASQNPADAPSRRRVKQKWKRDVA